MAYIQLTEDDCLYLQELMEEDVADFCAVRRSIAKTRVERYRLSPATSRLDSHDVTYLLQLVDCDDLEDTELQRNITRDTLEGIRELQEQAMDRQEKEAMELKKRKLMFSSRRQQPANPTIKRTDLSKIELTLEEIAEAKG